MARDLSRPIKRLLGSALICGVVASGGLGNPAAASTSTATVSGSFQTLPTGWSPSSVDVDCDTSAGPVTVSIPISGLTFSGSITGYVSNCTVTAVISNGGDHAELIASSVDLSTLGPLVIPTPSAYQVRTVDASSQPVLAADMFASLNGAPPSPWTDTISTATGTAVSTINVLGWSPFYVDASATMPNGANFSTSGPFTGTPIDIATINVPTETVFGNFTQIPAGYAGRGVVECVAGIYSYVTFDADQAGNFSADIGTDDHSDCTVAAELYESSQAGPYPSPDAWVRWENLSLSSNSLPFVVPPADMVEFWVVNDKNQPLLMPEVTASTDGTLGGGITTLFGVRTELNAWQVSVPRWPGSSIEYAFGMGPVGPPLPLADDDVIVIYDHVNDSPFVVSSSTSADPDGITDLVEVGAPGLGDGNRDGILDADQASVASLPVAAGTGAYLTVESVDGHDLINVKIDSLAGVNPPPPAAVSLPDDLVSFTVDVGTPGATTKIRVHSEDVTGVNGYAKLINGNWVVLDPTDVNIVINSPGTDGYVEIALTDGGQYDADGVKNGQIVDPGGIAKVAQSGTFIESLEPARLLETRSGVGMETIDGGDESVGVRAAGDVYELDVRRTRSSFAFDNP